MPGLEQAQTIDAGDAAIDQATHPLSAAQLDALTAKSDVRGLWLLACQFALTGTIFAGMAIWPNPFNILVGLVLLGGRQLGFFVLTHEAGHRTLFRSRSLNQFVSKWLTAPMDFSNGEAYMREHLQHHRAVGTADDPDLANYQDYPITRARLMRKLKRDLTGQTGWRNLSFKLKQFRQLERLNAKDRAALLRGLSWHIALLGIMTAAGVAWLFLVWVAAQIWAYPAIVRIRQVAEHAAVADLASGDARENTRTTLTNPLVRLVLCPHGVNYHVEHHLLASVPIYHLREMHQLLSEADYFAHTPASAGYLAVLDEVTQSPAAA